MTFSLRHQYTATLCIWLMIVGPITLSSCGPSDATPILAKLTLSAASIQPGQFFSILHSGIQAGSTVQVHFAGANGYEFTCEAKSTQNGSLRFPAPPFIDLQTGQFAAGTATVSLVGLDGEAQLSIENVPTIQTSKPGSLVRLTLSKALDRHTTLLSNLAEMGNQLDQRVDAATAETAINAVIQQLNSLISEYDAMGQMTFQNSDGTSRVLGAAELSMADQWLAAIVQGLAAEMPSGNATLRVRPAEGGNPAADAIYATVNGALDKVNNALQVGFAGGKR